MSSKINDDESSSIERSPTITHPPSRRRNTVSTFSLVCRTIVHHLKRHTGAGIMASVAYFDPGNWSVDLKAGSDYGYKLLFVILLAGLGAVVLQILACRLGCVTGLDLASHCRILLHDNPRHPRLVRRLLLYPLYALSEIAIVSTDLAELLGSAIALNLLIPALPLWVGVVLTSLDVLLVLVLTDGNKTRPARMFEAIIVLLVFAVLICFIVLIIDIKPHWGDVFHGFIPSKTLLNPGALYISIGILGATVMPHALFLGSSLATLDRVSSDPLPVPGASETRFPRTRSLKDFLRSLFFLGRLSTEDSPIDRHTRHEFRENNPYSFVKAHINHGMVDITFSLLGVAVPINSAILVLAGTVFFVDSSEDDAGLFDAHALISAKIGKAAGYIFAIALLCAGQSASITATLAGQIVSEGFLEWRISPFVRRLVTRLLGLIPSAIIAAVVGRSGIDALLVASQVALSIVLPFVVFPLVYLTSNHTVMRVERAFDAQESTPQVKPIVLHEEINYRNGKIMMTLGYLIFCLVLVANAYALVTLAEGKG